ncbi:cyanophycinase [Clostridium sp. 'deep sea']|uniref:cyanophycinase n=1 Tax=Clostridium sp. 'deep sea' TaxID=2779445 RepID=UPI001896910F|nr:cyanophycinase [Clostridium sp. 'deep sea']QOR34504.1 cyanophycinase [Clostridium sp. 'deep sea']
MNDSGLLLIIGGAEDHKGECVILKEFIRLAGGRGANIAILAVATQNQLRSEHMYSHIFRKLGAGSCKALHILDRSDANTYDLQSELEHIDGIFITGGDQLRITTMLGGTNLYYALHELHAKGTIIAGTSAGASVMSEIMILDGESDKPPTKQTVSLSPGLGLLEGIVIDQHFAQRGRLGRLLSIVAYNPHILGIGIDENTAVIVDDVSGEMKVIGEGAVTILDGKDIEFSNVATVSASQTLAVAGCKLYTLPCKYHFDLRSRKAINTRHLKEDN